MTIYTVIPFKSVLIKFNFQISNINIKNDILIWSVFRIEMFLKNTQRSISDQVLIWEYTNLTINKNSIFADFLSASTIPSNLKKKY